MITLVPSFLDNIPNNSAWCASFQLAFNELQYNILENDFVYNQNNCHILNLLAKDNQNYPIREQDYYVKSGLATPQLKQEIINTIKTKFNEKSDILDNFTFKEPTDLIFIYSILKKNMLFDAKFEDLGIDKFKNIPAKFWGAKSEESFKIITPLFYLNDKDFAVKIKTKDNGYIILYRTDDLKPFKIAYNDCIDKMKNNKQHYSIKSFKCPNLKANLIQEFVYLKGQNFKNNKNGLDYTIERALQTLKFNLDKSGATIKSEAGISMRLTAIYIPKIEVDFIFNDTFYLFCVDNTNNAPIGENKPCLALRVQDIGEYQ